MYFKINANKFNLITGHSFFSHFFLIASQIYSFVKLEITIAVRLWIFIFENSSSSNTVLGVALFLLLFYVLTLPFLGTQNLFTWIKFIRIEKKTPKNNKQNKNIFIKNNNNVSGFFKHANKYTKWYLWLLVKATFNVDFIYIWWTYWNCILISSKKKNNDQKNVNCKNNG